MPDYYDRDGNPISVDQWIDLFGQDDYKHVAVDDIGDVRVSTVWLGLDHQYTSFAPPLIFETMIFDGAYDGEQWRYSTMSEALVGHQRAVEKVRQSPTWKVRRTWLDGLDNTQLWAAYGAWVDSKVQDGDGEQPLSYADWLEMEKSIAEVVDHG